MRNRTWFEELKMTKQSSTYRKVDDCFVIFNSSNHVRFLKQTLKNRSVLNFTYETMQGNKFNFLDIEMSVQHDGKIETSVYIKPTDKGIYPNFHSHIPEQYKKSVINSLVNRAIKYCSSEPTLNAELDRIKQILSNNGYPQATTERIIRSKLANSNESQTPIETDNNEKSIRFYAQLFSLSKFKSDKKWLNQIVTAHVRGTEENSTVSVIAYYKPKKISSQFSTRSRDDGVDRVNVVYSFKCNEDACNASYVGYTAQTLQNRITQHKRQSSSICKHFMHEHDKLPPSSMDVFSRCFEIIYSSEDVRNLKIVEAITIKSEKPHINVKFNELYDFLQLF